MQKARRRAQVTSIVLVNIVVIIILIIIIIVIISRIVVIPKKDTCTALGTGLFYLASNKSSIIYTQCDLIALQYKLKKH